MTPLLSPASSVAHTGCSLQANQPALRPRGRIRLTMQTANHDFIRNEAEALSARMAGLAEATSRERLRTAAHPGTDISGRKQWAQLRCDCRLAVTDTARVVEDGCDGVEAELSV